MKLILAILCLLPLLCEAGGRRVRHLNPAHCGAVAVYDARQITGVADAAALSSWSDRSSGGYTLTAAGAVRPTYYSSRINGQPSVYFNGSQYISSASSVASTACTISAVVKKGGEKGTSSLAHVGANATDQGAGLGTDTAGTSAYKIYAFGRADIVGSADSAATLLRGQFPAAAGYTIYQRGVVGSTSSSVTLSLGAGLTVGALPANAFSVGFIGDVPWVVVFSSVPTAPIMRRIEHAAAFSFKIASQ